MDKIDQMASDGMADIGDDDINEDDDFDESDLLVIFILFPINFSKNVFLKTFSKFYI